MCSISLGFPVYPSFHPSVPSYYPNYTQHPQQTVSRRPAQAQLSKLQTDPLMLSIKTWYASPDVFGYCDTYSMDPEAERWLRRDRFRKTEEMLAPYKMATEEQRNPSGRSELALRSRDRKKRSLCSKCELTSTSGDSLIDSHYTMSSSERAGEPFKEHGKSTAASKAPKRQVNARDAATIANLLATTDIPHSAAPISIKLKTLDSNGKIIPAKLPTKLPALMVPSRAPATRATVLTHAVPSLGKKSKRASTKFTAEYRFLIAPCSDTPSPVTAPSTLPRPSLLDTLLTSLKDMYTTYAPPRSITGALATQVAQVQQHLNNGKYDPPTRDITTLLAHAIVLGWALGGAYECSVERRAITRLLIELRLARSLLEDCLRAQASSKPSRLFPRYSTESSLTTDKVADFWSAVVSSMKKAETWDLKTRNAGFRHDYGFFCAAVRVVKGAMHEDAFWVKTLDVWIEQVEMMGERVREVRGY